MAKKRKAVTTGNKLLDAWKPPEGAGHPVGCVATTFTFSPVFFEEECLGRFLQMQSDAIEDGPLYLIEREEKLADVRCVSVMVDAYHCKGNRSLRWDLLPARVLQAILHAKISILHWQHLIRVIVASANLTEDGYRRNQEIFGVVDYAEDHDSPLSFLDEITGFLADAANVTGGRGAENSPVHLRWLNFLDGIFDASRNWGSVDFQPGKKEPRVFAVLTGFGRPSALEQVQSMWPEGTPPKDAIVTSPFFDPPGVPNQPARSLWQILRQRGETTVTYNLTAEEVPGEEALYVHAPKEIWHAKPGRGTAITYLSRISETPGDEETVVRPVHFKSIWFNGNDWVGHLIGSSNFTTKGLGLGKSQNLEANLFYLVSRSGNSKAANQLRKGAPEGDPITNGDLRWKPQPVEGEDEADPDAVPLPAAFGTAIYKHKGESGAVEFQIAGEPPKGWQIFVQQDTDEILFDAQSWFSQGQPAVFEIEWGKPLPPSGFEVGWPGALGRAWWPVNVDRPSSLPPPDELKDLPLEALIRVLTSARPLHVILGPYLKRQQRGKAGGDNGPYDPHKRVDTSAFLLQKTYRVSAALAGLRNKLERPVPSEDALDWRLTGPVGVAAVSNAITKEAQSAEERAFLLTELALELRRVKPKSAPGCLNEGAIKEKLNQAIEEIRNKAFEHASKAPLSLKTYIQSAFQEG